MDPPLNARFNFYSQILRSTGSLGLLTRYPQDALCHEEPPSFSHPNRPEPCLLIQCNQPANHQCTIGGPGGLPVL